MSPSFWKRLSLVQSVCILALVVGAVWWSQRTKSRTRIETLRALYEFLKPAPPDDSVVVPIVVDIRNDNGEYRRYVNGELLDDKGLSQFAESVAVASPLDPFVVRPSIGMPIERVYETLSLLVAHGSKIFILPLDKETLALTDRNITPEGALPDLPPEYPRDPK